MKICPGNFRDLKIYLVLEECEDPDELLLLEDPLLLLPELLLPELLLLLLLEGLL
jgi:hypothetical protein